MTVFVQRRNGVVVGVYARAQSGVAEEELADNHADVAAYLTAQQRKVTFTRDEFLNRLTNAEENLFDLWLANNLAPASAPALKRMAVRFLTRDSFSISEATYDTFLSRLVTDNVITAQRRLELLEPLS